VYLFKLFRESGTFLQAPALCVSAYTKSVHSNLSCLVILKYILIIEILYFLIIDYVKITEIACPLDFIIINCNL
jgi:hypothetical protein